MSRPADGDADRIESRTFDELEILLFQRYPPLTLLGSFKGIARRLNQLVEMKQGYLDPLGAKRPRESGKRRTTSLDPASTDAEARAPRPLDQEPGPDLTPVDILINQEGAEFLKAYLLKHDDRHWRATMAYRRGDHSSRQAAADAFDSTPDRIRSRGKKLKLLLRSLLASSDS